MEDSINNPYEPGAIQTFSRESPVRFWTAFALLLAAYLYAIFIKPITANSYYPISDALAIGLMFTLIAIALSSDRRLGPSNSTRTLWIFVGAIYLFAGYASQYVFGSNLLESSKIPWLVILIATIHLFNSLVESRRRNLL